LASSPTSRSFKKYDLPERIAPIDEEASVRHQRPGDAPMRSRLELRVPAVQGADTDRERYVEGRFSRLQHKILDRNLPHAQPSGGDLVAGRRAGLLDSFGRAVNRENVPVSDASRDRACGRAGTAADLEYPKSGLERQRMHDGRESG
jgi:hypothetical protein